MRLFTGIGRLRNGTAGPARGTRKGTAGSVRHDEVAPIIGRNRGGQATGKAGADGRALDRLLHCSHC
ncbi:hypothetical protein GCM10017083_11680 [Thalassobaculum fulvum]|uniref:Uncharacterized protein n=1 Tax=Thalassobaculum fulvum TaxID=1633335 RepID=A0A918XQF0_9PROT|nr:hypothetical protein GCM10017083_11680 [Thalassobaculum fulvum]